MMSGNLNTKSTAGCLSLIFLVAVLASAGPVFAHPAVCVLSVCVPSNSAPSTPPTPSGPSQGSVYQSLTYSTSSSDADGDTITYLFNWGDGSQTLGGSVQSHAWSTAGSFCVRATAVDQHGTTSGASGCKTVTIRGDCITSGDAGNTFASALAMANPGSCRGHISPSNGDVTDFYQAYTGYGQTLAVWLNTQESCEGDLYTLVIWTPAGTVWQQLSATGCYGTSMVIQNAPYGGSWRFEARHAGGADPQGDYVMRVNV